MVVFGWIHGWGVGYQLDLLGSWTMNANETKRCAKCWKFLPISDFGHDGRTRDRLTYRCNDCRAQQTETITTTPHPHGEH